MTATDQRSPKPETGVRWGRVYGWTVLDHDSWMAGVYLPVPNDYIGQTRQKGRARENQHRDDKPWEDLTVGSPNVLWEGMCTDGQLDEMERRFIQRPGEDAKLRPRLNWRMNEDNPHQIPIPRQKEQRWARDAKRAEAAGVTAVWWEPTPYRPEVYGYTPAPARRSKPWRPWQKHLLGIGVVWAVLSAAGLVGLGYAGLLDPDTALADPMAGLVAGLWAWFGCPGVGKRWRRRFRNARRRFR